MKKQTLALLLTAITAIGSSFGCSDKKNEYKSTDINLPPMKIKMIYPVKKNISYSERKRIESELTENGWLCLQNKDKNYECERY